MAGYVLKIVMEDTHPPVWRRILVPDKITFGDLHSVIQLLFGWEDCHLHQFSIPADRIYIGDEECEGDYEENETLIDPFIRSYKWIRYTYDFGDDWRHKIIIEKTDAEYEERSVVLLKAKGENFREDSRGIWRNQTTKFEKDVVEQQLSTMLFPINPQLQEPKLLKESMQELREAFEKFMQLENWQVELQSKEEERLQNPSVIKQKTWEWNAFDSGEKFKIVSGTKTNKELLMGLGEQEATDYCKYLQIPDKNLRTREAKIEAIAEMFDLHPEYLLYVFDEKEYSELIRCAKLPEGTVFEHLKNRGMPQKMVALGLGDIQIADGVASFSFAPELYTFIDKIDNRTRKDIYHKLMQFDTYLGKLMQVYGMMELEELYTMYLRIYKQKVEKETFFRYVYWHARYNKFVTTVYTMDNICYVILNEIDPERVIRGIYKYSQDIGYEEYSKEELEYLAADIANRSEWLDMLFSTLHDTMGMDFYEAKDWMFGMLTDIMSGYTLNELIAELENQSEEKWGMETYVELWENLSGLMLEMELPMLKGRCRKQYADEQNIVPWTIGMTETGEDVMNTKEKHLYEFAPEVQQWLFDAALFGENEELDRLLEYKKQNGICSEEFLYLMIRTCIVFGKTELAEQMLPELKKSSFRGKKAANQLREKLNERYEVADDDFLEDDWEEGAEWDWITGRTSVQQPFVRQEKKIGRNDPCPCGSGKKYKKCCGKGK